MAAHAYPHMIFATQDSGFTRERLAGLVAELFGERASCETGSLNLVATIDGYPVTFWFDEDAEGLGERYADYLPETARRRRLGTASIMVDTSGADDAEGTHAATMTQVMTAIAGLEQVWVFSEAAKRFVGMDYDDATPEYAAPAPAEQPAPVPLAEPEPVIESAPAPEPEPIVEPAPAPQPVHVAEPEPVIESAPAPQPVHIAEPEPIVEPAPEPVLEAAPEPGPIVEPTPAIEPAPEPAPIVRSPAQPIPAEPAAEKQGVFKRLFGRRNR